MKTSEQFNIPDYENLPVAIKQFVQQFAESLRRNHEDMYQDMKPKYIGIPSGDATPSVKNGHLAFYYTQNASAVEITDFDDAADGQIIMVKLDGNTTINDGGNFKLTGNITGTTDDVVTFVHGEGIWYQTCLSAN